VIGDNQGLRCIICNGANTTICRICESSVYFSEKYRKENSSLHNMLCSVRAFSPQLLNKTGILLPVDLEIPKLVVIKYHTGKVKGSTEQPMQITIQEESFMKLENVLETKGRDEEDTLTTQQNLARGFKLDESPFVTRRKDHNNLPVNRCISSLTSPYLLSKSLPGLYR
jgi:hypothetical protein